MKLRSTVIIFLILFLSACSRLSVSRISPPVQTVEELLTLKTWKAFEIRQQLSDGNIYYYRRGSSSSSVNYDSDSLKFNNNNTGIYYYDGLATSTTWKFIDSEKTKMTIMILYPKPLRINWEYVNVSGTTLKYTQYASAGAISYLASGTRVPN